MEKNWKVLAGVFVAILVAITSSFLIPYSQLFQIFSEENKPKSVVFENGPSYQIRHIWDHNGRTWRYETRISQSAYEYFSNLERTSDYREYVNPSVDDKWLENLAKQFENVSERQRWGTFETIGFVLSFVQSLRYTSDKVTTGFDEYPRYPIETLVEQGGDCEDTSILFSSIIKEMNYGTVLIILTGENHMSSGVKISQEFVKNWSQPYTLSYYEKKGDYYAYCETTGTGWNLGEMPEKFKSTKAKIIELY